MSVDPGSLSKEKLKAELRRSGVTFNQYENKPYYVNLYRSKMKERESSRSEFSDDEEPSRSPRGSTKTQQKKKGPESRFASQVRDMSDATLRAMLVQHGENPGPILSSTRSVYERKLAQLLEESVTPRRRAPRVEQERTPGIQLEQQVEEEEEESFVAQAEDELSDDDMPVKKQRKPLRPRETEVVSSYNLRRRQGESRDVPDEVEVPPHSMPSPSRMRTSSQDSVNVWEIVWKLVVLILVVGVAFLVYDHATTPPGTKSIVIRSYEYLYPPRLMRILKPETCASRREKESSGKPPSDPDPPRYEEETAQEDKPAKREAKKEKPAKEEPKEKPAKKEPKEEPAKKELKKEPAKKEPKEEPAKKEPKEEPKKEPEEEPAKEEPKKEPAKKERTPEKKDKSKTPPSPPKDNTKPAKKDGTSDKKPSKK